MDASRVKHKVYFRPKCRATQKKSVKHIPHIFLVDYQVCVSQDNRSFSVKFVMCKGCVADTNGGVCSHVFALLTVMNEQRLRGGIKEEVSSA